MSDPQSGHVLFRSATPGPEVIREFADRGTLWLLEDPAALRDLLQILEPELTEQLDFSRAERVNRSFIPDDLRKQESDLIFSVPLREEAAEHPEVWIYVLLEHQSRRDPLMPLRLYQYMGHLWEAQEREWKDRQIPAELRRGV
jgi:predicted transposase YdaD